MAILVKMIGIFITAIGIIILLKPKTAKGMLVFWRQGNNLYIGGFIRAILALIFLYYAPQARWPRMILTLGVLSALGGVSIFILGLKKSREFIDWWDRKPEPYLRLISLLVLAFGALILYSV